MQTQSSSRSRKKKDKSVFDASHFEESDDSESSSSGRKHVRFKQPSTPTRSSRTRTTKPIDRSLAPRTILLLVLLLIVFSVIRFNSYLLAYAAVAVNFAKPLINSTWASLPRRHHDQVPPHIAEYVQQAISGALRTTLQRPNYALRSRGAIILPFLTTPTEDTTCEPDDLLEEDDSSQPCCFFPGDRGQFAIRLSQLIHPTHVTIDYTPPMRAMSRHAPRHMVLWGLVDGSGNKALFDSLRQFRADHKSLGDGPSNVGSFVFLPFANFTFDVHGAFPVQMFPIHSEIVFAGMSSGVYILEVRSNWGRNSTGICRVRLHGEEAS